MTKTPVKQHAFDLLDVAPPTCLPPLVALVGKESFLVSQVTRHLLGKPGDDTDYVRYNGEEAVWRDVADELATASLFRTGPRRVVIQDADLFVSNHRTELEKYAGSTALRGTLLLEVGVLAANTRLYQAAFRHGLLIDCRLPEIETDRSRKLDLKRLMDWLQRWASSRHGIQLSDRASELLVELIGWQLGRLDQELAKLALFLPPQGTADDRLVQQVVGGWTLQTNWEMMDAVGDGDAAAALKQLDQLLQAGESPLALFGSIAWSLRRFAAATRAVERQEQLGGRALLQGALQSAGFRTWPPGALERAEKQLRQITRRRGGQLYRWLLETDLALKGSHSSPNRSRWALELLFLRLARGEPNRTIAAGPPGPEPRTNSP